jgi:hypothetical protein
MNLSNGLRAVLAVSICLLIVACARIEQPADRLSELKSMSRAELEQERQRAMQEISRGDEFAWASRGRDEGLEYVAKAQLIGDIVMIEYLVDFLREQVSAPMEFAALPQPFQVTIVQRHTKPITQIHEALKIHIGDITGGQVLLEVIAEGLRMPLVDTVSVQPGDVVPVPCGDKEYYLTVVELRNFLIGDDFAVLEISAKRPDEIANIEDALKIIEKSGVIFIRNGQEATAEEAVEHLRRKWEFTTPRVSTLEGFIARIATRSSTTGVTYQVKMQDGSVREVAPWLREQLGTSSQ